MKNYFRISPIPPLSIYSVLMSRKHIMSENPYTETLHSHTLVLFIPKEGEKCA